MESLHAFICRGSVVDQSILNKNFQASCTYSYTAALQFSAVFGFFLVRCASPLSVSQNVPNCADCTLGEFLLSWQTALKHARTGKEQPKTELHCTFPAHPCSWAAFFCWCSQNIAIEEECHVCETCMTSQVNLNNICLLKEWFEN